MIAIHYFFMWANKLVWKNVNKNQCWVVIQFGPIVPLVLILVSKNQIKFGFNFGFSFKIGIKIEINFFQFIKIFLGNVFGIEG